MSRSAAKDGVPSASSENRIFLTTDHDIGLVVYRNSRPHRGVLLVDDVGDAAGKSSIILAALSAHFTELVAGAFFRAGPGGVREAES
jgi:hypothetical protein